MAIFRGSLLPDTCAHVCMPLRASLCVRPIACMPACLRALGACLPACVRGLVCVCSCACKHVCACAHVCSWLCGCLTVWLCGCLTVWLWGCLAVWLSGCVALCAFAGCVAVWLCGCVVVALCGSLCVCACLLLSVCEEAEGGLAEIIQNIDKVSDIILLLSLAVSKDTDRLSFAFTADSCRSRAACHRRAGATTIVAHMSDESSPQWLARWPATLQQHFRVSPVEWDKWGQAATCGAGSMHVNLLVSHLLVTFVQPCPLHVRQSSEILLCKGRE